MRKGWAAAGIAAVTVLACGSGGGDIASGIRSKNAPPPPALPAAGVHTVPPDRALVPVSVRATGEDFATAAKALRERIATVEAAGAEGACEVRTLDYTPPHTNYGERGLVASAALVADLPLVGLATVPERMDRLDACLDALTGTDIAAEELGIGAASLRVDVPEASFDLLAQRLASAGARAASTAGPQSHPEDRRCVPTGGVRVGEARLSGVDLSLEVECRIDADPGPTGGA